MADPKAFVREYIGAIQAGATGDALARFFTDDVVQEEFPNRLMPAGATRNLAAILEGAQRGQLVMRKQEFQIHNVVSSDSTVIVELTWLGTLAIAIGALTPGGQMRARFCIVLELKDGRIHRQRNYDCFDAF
jgi:ketosteroid isomerase-like protein